MHGTVNLLAETESITSSPIAIFPLVLLASLRLRRPWAVQSVRTETISLAALGCIPRKTYSNGALRLKSTIWGSFGNLARLLGGGGGGGCRTKKQGDVTARLDSTRLPAVGRSWWFMLCWACPPRPVMMLR